MYAREQNGQVRVGLPKTGKLSDGRSVSNYRALPEETLLAEGWLPFVDEKPEEQEGFYSAATGYDVQETQIVRTYEMAAIPEPVEEVNEMDELRQAVADLAELILEV